MSLPCLQPLRRGTCAMLTACAQRLGCAPLRVRAAVEINSINDNVAAIGEPFSFMMFSFASWRFENENENENMVFVMTLIDRRRPCSHQRWYHDCLYYSCKAVMNIFPSHQVM
jgi:hypothetical protein